MKKLLKKVFNGFQEWLPVTVISRDPNILISFETDFFKSFSEVRASLDSQQPVHVLLHLGWECESEKRAQEVVASLQKVRMSWPLLRTVVLCNANNEVLQLKSFGEEAILCNHNVFLDYRRFRADRSQKNFDAVYLARITPFKRYELTFKSSNLLVIGDCSTVEKSYAASVLDRIPYKKYLRKVGANQISKWFNQANCGLCLSAAEGAMFSSAEYLLCGIPVVNTPALGGRTELFPDFACRNVEDNPEAVAAGIEYWKKNPVDPDRIRSETIQKIEEGRQAFFELIQGIFDQAGVKRDFRAGFDRLFHHKWALRSEVWFWQRFRTGLSKKRKRL